MDNIEYDYEGWPIPEGHHLTKELTIGTIDFSEEVLTEDEIISKTGRYNPSGIGECKIEVYGGEGDIPHFHLFSTDKSFQSCIWIYSNFYFSHGGKYKDKLNSKQCKKLDEWLSSKNKNFPTITNWETIRGFWENMNPLCRFPESKKADSQPYYRNMTNYKDR